MFIVGSGNSKFNERNYTDFDDFKLAKCKIIFLNACKQQQQAQGCAQFSSRNYLNFA